MIVEQVERNFFCDLAVLATKGYCIKRPKRVVFIAQKCRIEYTSSDLRTTSAHEHLEQRTISAFSSFESSTENYEEEIFRTSHLILTFFLLKRATHTLGIYSVARGTLRTCTKRTQWTRRFRTTICSIVLSDVRFELTALGTVVPSSNTGFLWGRDKTPAYWFVPSIGFPR